MRCHGAEAVGARSAKGKDAVGERFRRMKAIGARRNRYIHIARHQHTYMARAGDTDGRLRQRQTFFARQLIVPENDDTAGRQVCSQPRRVPPTRRIGGCKEARQSPLRRIQLPPSHFHLPRN